MPLHDPIFPAARPPACAGLRAAIRTPVLAAAGTGLALALLPAPAARAHDDHMPVAEQSFAAETLAPAVATVVDRDGRARDFRDEIVGEGPLMMTFVYTSCTTVCPIANAIFQGVEDELAARGDAATRLVSVSVDPRHDTPERFAALAQELGAGPRWDFVTGDVAEVERALRSMGVGTGRVEDHDPMFLIRRAGDPGFVRVLGLPEPARLLALLDGSDPTQ